jgi:ABC-type Fe3+ transport system substrate-binding protein
VEAHTVAVIKGCKHPQSARDFIDFLLTPEVQGMLARLYGETPVNPKADHGSGPTAGTHPADGCTPA